MTQDFRYYNPAAAIGTSGQDAQRYGAYQNVANAARDQQRQGLGSARRDMAQQIAGMTSQGANPFGAARAAGRAYEQQAGQIRAQASQQMADAAAMEAQRREQEMLRKQQEARQLIGGGLSTAGAVLGTVIGGPLGASAGGGVGGALGGALGGGATMGVASTPTPGSEIGGVAGSMSQAQISDDDKRYSALGADDFGIVRRKRMQGIDVNGPRTPQQNPLTRHGAYLGSHARTFGYAQLPPEAYRTPQGPSGPAPALGALGQMMPFSWFGGR
jgi:hypothetical protein